MRFYKVSSFIQRYFHRYTWRMNPREKFIYLTFDDGPHDVATPEVLDILKNFNIPATFFCVGENVQNYPNVMERIVSEGHSIGNHTQNHLKGWTCPSKKYLENTQIAAIGLSAYTKSNLFRPPYGRIRKQQATELLKKGYKIIMWDILTYDYDNTLNIQSCIDAISRKSRNGSIVVFHDSLKSRNQTIKILPVYIQNMLNLGYQFKSLNSCFS